MGIKLLIQISNREYKISHGTRHIQNWHFKYYSRLNLQYKYYLSGLLFAFKNGRLEISDNYSFDLPTVFTAADWANLVNDFLNNAEIFATHVEHMDDKFFDQPFIDEKYANYLRNIDGIIEHIYYHLGQISLKKKMM